MSSKHLVDPQLLPFLEAFPALDPTPDALPSLRAQMSGRQVPAPPAPEVRCEERLIQGVDGGSVRLLLFLPPQASRSGGLIWLHGGGMVMGTPEMNEPLCRYLAHTLACVVAAVDYRLAPEHPYPAGLEDCYAALRWMHTAAQVLQLPPERIAVAGESGGGCLAAGLCLLARERGEFALSAQFLLYPMLDDRTGTAFEPEPSLPFTGEFIWTRKSNHSAWQAVLHKEPGTADTPVFAAPGRSHQLAGLPPTTILIGELDLFLAETLRYVHCLLRDGVCVEFHLYPGAYHGFASFGQEAAVSKRAFDDLTQAMTRHFLH